MFTKSLALLCVCAAAGFFASASSANVVFTAGNNPQPGEENVLLNTGTTGTTVSGATNQSNILVKFTSSQELTEPANGQARIEATGGSLNDVTVSLPGGDFGDIIFNAFSGTGDLNITAVASDGTFNFVQPLGNGQNFVTLVATDAERILSVTLSAPDGFTDLRQVRISGATGTDAGGGPAVPLPAAAWTGLAALGALAGFRRRQSVSS